MSMHQTCDGITRRDCLRVGMLGIGGWSLADYLRQASANEIRNANADRAIFIELPGGPSHIDSFDPKPDAPIEIRGKFKSIETNVSGIRLSEHLPKLATCADKYAILRGVSHTLAAHELGREYINTGSRPLPSIEYPAFGSAIAMQMPTDSDIPTNVAIPRVGQGPGFLGIRYAALETNSTPRFGQPYAVRGLSASGGISIDEIHNRQKLLDKLDRRFADVQSDRQLIDGLDRFGEQAYSMITSARAKAAFDVSKEPVSFAKPFGEDSFGMSCLLALRLIESGVRYVTVQLGGWDTHQDNFKKLESELLPKLDTGLSALLLGLEQRGLLESTAVYATGEFGRTPKISDRSSDGGRDHYPRCMFMLMAGGGVQGGQVIGESDATGAAPKHEAITPDDVAASFYHNLGIDPSIEFETETGRPITLVRNGNIIKSLFA